VIELVGKVACDWGYERRRFPPPQCWCFGERMTTKGDGLYRISSRFPTFSKTSIARSKSALLCVEATMVRTRALPWPPWGTDAGGQHAFLEQLAREPVRQRRFADNHRRDGRLADPGVETSRREAVLE